MEACFKLFESSFSINLEIPKWNLHKIEKTVPLMRINIVRGTNKMVPLIEGSTYLNKLREVCLSKTKGPEKLVPLNESSTYPGFHLSRVDCTF